MTSDPSHELRVVIRGLFTKVNAGCRHISIQLPIDLNNLNPLELAELYHELRVLLIT